GRASAGNSPAFHPARIGEGANRIWASAPGSVAARRERSRSSMGWSRVIGSIRYYHLMSAFPTIDPAVGRRVLDLVRGCTFDDFIFAPQRSVLDRRDPGTIDLSCRLSRRLTLRRPIVSANMDTVTRAPMAIVQAEEGGIGIIDRGFR